MRWLVRGVLKPAEGKLILCILFSSIGCGCCYPCQTSESFLLGFDRGGGRKPNQKQKTQKSYPTHIVFVIIILSGVSQSHTHKLQGEWTPCGKQVQVRGQQQRAWGGGMQERWKLAS